MSVLNGIVQNNTFNTMNDYLKYTGNDTTKVGDIVREMETSYGWSSLVPISPCAMKSVKEGDEDRFIDESVFEGAYEHDTASKRVLVDEPGVDKTYVTYKTYDYMAMRKIRSTIYKHEIQMNVNEMKLWRIEKLRRLARDTKRDIEIDYLYNDASRDERACSGLYPRFTMITDHDGIIQNGTNKGKVSRYITIDAGGTGSNLTSILLIVPDARGVTRLMPAKGTDFGPEVRIQMGDTDLSKLWPEDDKKREYTIDKADVVYGIAVRNRGACVRIANIDVSSSDATNVMKIRRAYRRAYEALDENMRTGNVLAIMNGEVPLMLADFADATSIGNQWEEVQVNNIPLKKTNILPGAYVSECSAITLHEDRVE